MSEMKIKRKERGVRKESTLTTSGESLEVGNTFTIEGCGIGKRGQKIIGGRSVDTNRKAKPVTLTVYRVTGRV